MKSSKKIVLILALVLMVCCLFAACTENTKWDKVSTDTTYTEVTSNGGVAVQYGNYLYFVNGYAGAAALNTFGSVKTGAVCRVEIKKDNDGKLSFDYDTFQVVVPKNVYGSDTTNGGIYIANGYIYYHTTSVDKNSKREYKTDEGVLMRTKIDGTGTETLKSFSDNSTVFRVIDNYLVFTSKDGDSNTTLKAFKLDNMSEITIESNNVLAYNFSDNYVVYTTYNTERTTNSTSDYLVKLFDCKTGNVSVALSSDIYNSSLQSNYLFTTTIKTVRENADTLFLFYTKDDNSTNDIYNGYYMCRLSKANPVYNAGSEFRMTLQTDTTTYDNFFCLNNGWVLAYHEKVFDIYTQFVDGTAKRMENTATAEKDGSYISYTITGATALVGVYENDSEVYAYFTTSPTVDSKTYTAINYIKLFNKENNVYTIAKENVAVFFYFNYNSSYTTYEVSDLYYYEANGKTSAKAVYYLNSDLGDNAFACYYILQNDIDHKDAEEKAPAGKLLGKIEGEKLVTLISSGAVEEK